jgi:ectoine hydroxylase-related dioxygenase (phytanoyl-CoA dioxygenase family)
MTTKRQELVEDGYCVFENVLDGPMLARVQGLARGVVEAIPAAHRAETRSQGSLVPVADHPAFAELIAHEPARAIFAELGFADPRFSSGYVISKPPKGPALFWHQDWWGWDDPISHTDQIAQVFLFYYLSDTTRDNGCLRVVRGSHRTRHPLHDAPKAHADDIARVVDPSDRIYQPVADEVAVEVRTGDLVIGDARILHGTYPNASDRERTLITLWYHPSFASLPEPMQARIHAIHVREGVDTDAGGQMYPALWPERERHLVEPLLPVYDGSAAPQAWNREPVGLRGTAS